MKAYLKIVPFLVVLAIVALAWPATSARELLPNEHEVKY